MNGDLARLPGMTAIESRPSRARDTAPTPVPGGTRLERRAALDLSIDEEILRGELRGEALSEALRADLALLVQHELKEVEPLLESRFLTAGPRHGLFTAGRRRRNLEALVGMSLVRREGATVHATVAGIAAILRHSPDAETAPPSRGLLRALRRAEISGLLP